MSGTLNSGNRLWYMNADFEMELAALPSPYRRLPTIARRNQWLARSLLWLAKSGDALLVEPPWPDALHAEATRADVELLDPALVTNRRERKFTPWGWTPSAVTLGEATCALVDAPPIDVVARVNSKLFSHALEREYGIAEPGARIASSMQELDDAVADACPGSQDKWVVKSPFGFAARGRVLGRGPKLDPASATWAERQFRNGKALLFERWHAVVHEYGIPIWIRDDGSIEIEGVVDVATNGAGAALGYRLGRAVDPGLRATLERTATRVGQRLHSEGYRGPAGIDALEHESGLRPLLEINARYTMGFVALAVERILAPIEPTFWSSHGKDEG
jgi:hypothetical protein